MTKHADNQPKNSQAKKLLKDGLGSAGHVARNNLERLGSLIDSLNAKSKKAQQFKAVDLSNFETRSADNVFSQQTLKASEQLLGPRFATYGKYTKKVVPDSIFEKVTDGAFAQLAKLAASWSQLDLPDEHRFSGIQQMDDQERNALAQDIINQNRALAILSGVTGLAGLPGLLADTLWLLLVSLRTVYQLANVYDKPLTGKQGIKVAYAVLSSADLSKMQEKQAILAGLGVAKGLLENADNQGLRSELKNMGINSTQAQFYAEQVDKLVEQFNLDIDGINLSWLLKFMPLTSVAIGSYYNSHLIDQVIGTAKATFGPEPKMAKQALTDQSGPSLGKEFSASDIQDESKNDADKEDADKDEDSSEGSVDNAIDDSTDKDATDSDHTREDDKAPTSEPKA